MSNIRVTKEQIDKLIADSKIEVTKFGTKSTVVMLTLPNGFFMTESSSCVDPENYDHELGRRLCLKHIKDKLWAFEGYRLQCERYRLQCEQSRLKAAGNCSESC